MTTISPVSGSNANCTFDPPVSTPTRRMQASAASRISWYSTSLSVWAGATVIESPVCTPIGSTFSIEQMITQLSAWSRMTSSSYSFHPTMDCSIRISEIGLAAKPLAATFSNSFQPISDSSMSTSLTGEASIPRCAMTSNSSRL